MTEVLLLCLCTKLAREDATDRDLRVVGTEGLSMENVRNGTFGTTSLKFNSVFRSAKRQITQNEKNVD